MDRKLSRVSGNSTIKMDRKLSRVSNSSRKRSLRPSISEYVRRASNFQVQQAKRKLSQKEKILDKEIEYDEAELKGTQLQEAQRLGEIVLHSKIVLLLVVIINLLDCCLVLGELILDIHYIKDLLHQTEETSADFIYKMKENYPDQFTGVTAHDMDVLYEKLLTANCSWSKTGHSTQIEHFSDHVHTHIKRNVNNEVTYSLVTNATHVHSADAHMEHHDDHGDHGHSVWEDIAHGLHKASITLLAILVFETLLKVSCMGRRFFNNKLEVFDGFIVIGSFTLDLIFIKGLTIYRIQDNILILSFLLPWRVIRVVNSLIVAIIDHEHFRLKLLYKEKKTIAAELKDLKEKEEKFESILTKIETYCEEEGIPKWKIRQHTAMLRKQSTITSFASLALGGMLNGFLETTHHKPLTKSVSEPIPPPASSTATTMRQTKIPSSHNVRSLIVEEKEEYDNVEPDSPIPRKAKTFEYIQPKGKPGHVQIVITEPEDDDEDEEDFSENGKDSREQKPLLQRQKSFETENEVSDKATLHNDNNTINDKQV